MCDVLAPASPSDPGEPHFELQKTQVDGLYVMTYYVNSTPGLLGRRTLRVLYTFGAARLTNSEKLGLTGPIPDKKTRTASNDCITAKDTLEFLMTTVRSDKAVAIAPYLFRMGFFPASIFTKEAGLSQSTAKRLVRSLKEAGIIVEILPHRGSSPAVLAFPELLKIVESVEVAADRL